MTGSDPELGDATAERARALATRALDWIASVGVDADGGCGWLEGDALCDEFYSGTAGVLFGCAEAAACGLDTGAVAAGARGRLLHLAAHSDMLAPLPDEGLFTGWSGVAVALRAWSDLMDDAEAGVGATRIMTRVAERVLSSSDDPAANVDVISGYAGILLALLTDGSAPASAAAGLLADRLVAMAEPAPGGLQWRMTLGYSILMPGFSHGTAGVAYALIAAGQILDRPDLTAAAVHGAEALLLLGTTPSGWALPLAVPRQAHRPEVYYGWCHGPIGTLRLFLALDAIDAQPRWQQAVQACLQAVADSGLPARLHPGFWDNVGRCCGSAGVGMVLLERYRATGDPELLRRADVLAADVMDRAVATPAGIAWSNTEHTATPPDLAPEPGFMQGAAGILGWLARHHAVHAGRELPAGLVRLDPSWI